MMIQQLAVNLTIPIPEDSVLIKRIELQELQQEQLLGVWWNMKDLERRISREQQWIKEKILYPTRFRKILDTENGGFVFYPKNRGQPWSFKATEMAEFLDKHFQDILEN